MNYFDIIPVEISQMIFSLLTPEDGLIAQQVSKSWREELSYFNIQDYIHNDNKQALMNVKLLRKYDFTNLVKEGNAKQTAEKIYVRMFFEEVTGKLLAIESCFMTNSPMIIIKENASQEFEKRANRFFLSRKKDDFFKDKIEYTMQCQLRDDSKPPHFSWIVENNANDTLHYIKGNMISILNQMAVKAMNCEDRGFNNSPELVKRKRNIVQNGLKERFNAMKFYYNGKIEAVDQSVQRDIKRPRSMADKLS